MTEIIEYIQVEPSNTFVLYAENKEYEIPVPVIEKWFIDHGYFNWLSTTFLHEINDIDTVEGSYADIEEYMYYNNPKRVLKDLNKFFNAQEIASA